MAGNVVIRPVGQDERAAWEPLWNGYLTFYKATLAPGASDVAWQRFHDPDEPMFLLGAYVDGKLTGIVQFLFHRSTWSPDNYCYLNDLFVTDAARGLAWLRFKDHYLGHALAAFALCRTTALDLIDLVKKAVRKSPVD